MSSLENFDERWEEEETALISIDVDNAIYVTRGLIGTGHWFREPCGCPDSECPAQEGGQFKVISLIITDVDGNEQTILIPAESQFAETLTDLETIQAVRNALEA